MSDPDRRPGRGPGRDVRLTRALVGAVLAVLVLVVLVTALLGHGQGGGAGPAGAPGRADGDEAAAPPAPPPLLRPLPAVGDGAPAPPSAAGLARVLDPLLADPALGPRVSAAVVDAGTGALLFTASPPGGAAVVPASTGKLVTAAAALAVLGPAERLTTRVVAGAGPGELVLVGGGDPTLASPGADPGLHHGGTPPARLADLADAAAAALAADGVEAVPRLAVDAGLFGPPQPAPGWRPSYLTDGHVAPVTALSVDAGRVRPDRLPRHPEPDLAAGRALAALLRERGLAVAEPVRGEAPPGAPVLAEVRSPPVGALVETLLGASDNDLAEALARHVALATGHPGTATGAARAVGEAVARLGVDPAAVRVADGSGLSRDSRVEPAALAGLLATAASPERPELRPLLSGLPTAGFGGTLADRYRAGPPRLAAGEAWAKTGTLTGVNALAGLVVDARGRLLAFDVTADAVPGGRRPAEAALDRVVAALAGCGCA